MTEPRRSRPVEWPTFVMLAISYGGFLISGLWLWHWAPVTGIVLMGVFITLQSSLQHEVLHGHPTANAAVNEALVFVTLGVYYPYRRFKATHLAHHHDERLTDPYDDPESKYLALKDWLGLPDWFQRLMVFNNTLLGRMTIGPAIGIAFFILSDLREIGRDRKIQLAWALHVAGQVPLYFIVTRGFEMSYLFYMLVPAYLGNAILTLRTFCEHRWADDPKGRTIIVERTPFSWLFLNNNLHIVHHSLPAVAWYKLPELYREKPTEWKRINGGYVFRNYFEIARAYLFTPKEPVVHPALRREDGPAEDRLSRPEAAE